MPGITIPYYMEQILNTPTRTLANTIDDESGFFFLSIDTYSLISVLLYLHDTHDAPQPCVAKPCAKVNILSYKVIVPHKAISIPHEDYLALRILHTRMSRQIILFSSSIGFAA